MRGCLKMYIDCSSSGSPNPRSAATAASVAVRENASKTGSRSCMRVADLVDRQLLRHDQRAVGVERLLLEEAAHLVARRRGSTRRWCGSARGSRRPRPSSGRSRRRSRSARSITARQASRSAAPGTTRKPSRSQSASCPASSTDPTLRPDETTRPQAMRSITRVGEERARARSRSLRPAQPPRRRSGPPRPRAARAGAGPRRPRRRAWPGRRSRPTADRISLRARPAPSSRPMPIAGVRGYDE